MNQSPEEIVRYGYFGAGQESAMIRKCKEGKYVLHKDIIVFLTQERQKAEGLKEALRKIQLDHFNPLNNRCGQCSEIIEEALANYGGK